MKKDRGKFLTLLLVFFLFIFASAFYAAPTIKWHDLMETVPYWYINYLYFSFIVDIIIFIGIWLWKKVAVYFFVITEIFGIFIDTFVLKLTQEGVNNGIIGLIMLGVLLYAINRKWKYFG